MQSKDGLKAEFMHRLFLDGLIGIKEFRNWLANAFLSYGEIRDPSIDAQIDTIARVNAERRRNDEDEDDSEQELE